MPKIIPTISFCRIGMFKFQMTVTPRVSEVPKKKQVLLEGFPGPEREKQSEMGRDKEVVLERDTSGTAGNTHQGVEE